MGDNKDMTQPQEPSIAGNMPDKAHETEVSETLHNPEVMKYGNGE